MPINFIRFCCCLVACAVTSSKLQCALLQERKNTSSVHSLILVVTLGYLFSRHVTGGATCLFACLLSCTPLVLHGCNSGLALVQCLFGCHQCLLALGLWVCCVGGDALTYTKCTQTSTVPWLSLPRWQSCPASALSVSFCPWQMPPHQSGHHPRMCQQ